MTLYIILGILFLITWIVIGVSCTKIDAAPAKCGCTCDRDSMVYGLLTRDCPHVEIYRLKTELGSVRSQVRELRSERFADCTKTTAELLRTKSDYPPKEIKVGTHKYKLEEL